MKTIWTMILLALAALGMAIILTGCSSSRPEHVEYVIPSCLQTVVVGERNYINKMAKQANVQMGPAGVLGFYDAFDGIFYVVYDSAWGESTMPRLETLGHEFGHALWGLEFYP
jgi:hypothetical protein